MSAMSMMRRRIAAWFAGAGANQNQISLFDVKALYDAAYDEKAKARACLKTFKSLLEQAEKLDLAYRAQIAAEKAYLYGKAV